MKRYLLRCCLTLCAALAAAGAPAAELQPGDPAPDFALPGSDGKTHKLSDHLGKEAVVIAWFPKAKTPGCTLECKSMRENGDALRKLEVAYYTASCDKPELNKEFAEQLQVDYPILSDPEKTVAAAYGVSDGKIPFAKRWTIYIGKDGKILAIDKEVKTKTHGADVAAKLKELGVPEK